MKPRGRVGRREEGRRGVEPSEENRSTAERGRLEEESRHDGERSLESPTEGQRDEREEGERRGGRAEEEGRKEEVSFVSFLS